MPPPDSCSVSTAGFRPHPDAVTGGVVLQDAGPQRTGPQRTDPQRTGLRHWPLVHPLWHLLRDGAGVFGRLVDRGFDWYGCRHVALKNRRELARLDDAMLKDIGLSRADIECEIEKPFWR